MTSVVPTAPPISPPRRSHRVRFVVIALFSAGIVVSFVPRYLGFDASDARVGIRTDVPFHYPVLAVHAITAGLALLLGPLQFSARLRRRAPRAHRVVGRVYVPAVLVAGLAGMVVAVLTTSGPIAATSFVLLDGYWVGTTIAGYRAVRARRFRSHERWMRRSFAGTFSAVTLRLWLGILIAVQLPLLGPLYHGSFGHLFSTAYVASSVLAWIPNLLVMELYLRRHRPGR